MINKYSVGKLVYLRVPESDDAESNWYTWLSDPEITKFLVDRFWPNSRTEQLKFINDSITKRDRLVLLICNNDNDKLIGVGSLSAINWVHRYADLSIIIADKQYERGAVVIDAFLQFIEIAFSKLNLENLKCSTAEENLHSIMLQKFFEFEFIGKIPNLLHIRGKKLALVYSYISKEKWLKLKSKRF